MKNVLPEYFSKYILLYQIMEDEKFYIQQPKNTEEIIISRMIYRTLIVLCITETLLTLIY